MLCPSHMGFGGLQGHRRMAGIQTLRGVITAGQDESFATLRNPGKEIPKRIKGASGILRWNFFRAFGRFSAP